MKIMPDFEGRIDEYDDETIRYYEKIDEDGYFYELYVLVDGDKAAIHITDNGVSIEFLWGDTIFTDITPNKIFPEAKELDWDKHIAYILWILKKEKMKTSRTSAEEMKELYYRWQRETGHD